MTLVQAFDLAKIQEEKYTKLRKYLPFSTDYTSNFQHLAISATAILSSNPPLLPNPHRSLSVKRLSSLEYRIEGTIGFATSATESLYAITSAKADLFCLYTKMITYLPLIYPSLIRW